MTSSPLTVQDRGRNWQRTAIAAVSIYPRKQQQHPRQSREIRVQASHFKHIPLVVRARKAWCTQLSSWQLATGPVFPGHACHAWTSTYSLDIINAFVLYRS